MSKPLDFGLQSWSLRAFKDNNVVIEKLKELGLNSVELCAAHADFNNPEEFEKVVALYKNAGIKIVSLGVQTFNGQDNEEKWFECLKIAGAKHISAHFKVETFTTAVPKTAKLAEKYDVKVGVHCHGGYMFGGSPDVLNAFMQLGGERIGVNIDTAWCMQIGPYKGNPIQWVKNYKERVHGVHYKDFVFESNGGWKEVVIGTGSLQVAELIKTLEEHNFDGMAVIEYEANSENPIPDIKECIKNLRALAVTA